MSGRLFCATFFTLFAAHSLRADVTLRRSTTVVTGPGLPQQIQAQVKQQLAAGMPPDSVIRIKGDKSYASMGALIGITDNKTGQITLLDPKNKQFSKGTLAEYLDGMAAATTALTKSIPADAQQLLQGMKFDVQTRKTGVSEKIQGIACDESVVTLAMGMPIGQTVMPTIRLEMHLFTAQPSEITRNPALKELAAYNTRNKDTMDPAAMLQKMFGQLPGLGEQLRKPIAQLTAASGGLMLRMHASIYIPALAQALPQIDPSKAMEELQTEVTEFSTTPVDDSVFTVPGDYQLTPLPDLIRVLMPTPAAAPAPPAAQPAAPPQQK